MRRMMQVTLTCGAAVLFGLMLVGLLRAQAKEEATVLFDFEDAADAGKWEAMNAETSNSTEHATSGKNSLKVVLKPADYPGINTTKLPADWSGYKALKFDVFAETGFNLLVRIDDVNSKDYASRYNLDENELAKGAGTVSLSLDDVGDKIDLKQVKLLILFGVNVADDTVFYLDNVRLVK